MGSLEEGSSPRPKVSGGGQRSGRRPGGAHPPPGGPRWTTAWTLRQWGEGGQGQKVSEAGGGESWGLSDFTTVTMWTPVSPGRRRKRGNRTVAHASARGALPPPPMPRELCYPSPQGIRAGRLRRSVGQGAPEPQREPGGRGGCRALPVTASCRQKNTNQFTQI